MIRETPTPEQLATFSESQVDEQTDSNRKMDPELKAMSAILRLMTNLPWTARGRVAAYVLDRYVKNSEDHSSNDGE